MTEPAELFHILRRPEWDQARRAGDYRPPSLETEGFIHFSTAHQVAGTADRFYAGVRDLLVLRVRRDRLRAELRFDPVDGDAFPHLYGPLNLDAVVAVAELPLPDSGGFQMPDEWRSERDDPG